MMTAMADPVPIRSRLKFSVRTLWIGVTLNCVVVGWFLPQASLVWERQAMLTSALGAYVDDDGAGLSWVRHFLGDMGMGLIQLGPSASDAELSRCRALFPEASVFRSRPLNLRPRSHFGTNFRR
jgi:hypothetical protein